MENGAEKKVVEWLDSIVGAPTRELGLLISDTVRKWRFNNQLRILQSAQEKCRKRNISIKVISPKLLCPLLDFASLEDDEVLQDKWANLLVNMLDSNQNIQNHVFPFILSQISKNEFVELNKLYSEKKDELKDLIYQVDKIDIDIKEHSVFTRSTHKELEKLHGKDALEADDFFYQQKDQWEALLGKKYSFIQQQVKLKRISAFNFATYELSNLLRLGIIINIPTDESENLMDYTTHIEQLSFYYSLTELGLMFLEACNEESTNVD